MRPRQSSPAQVCSDRVESVERVLHLHVGVLVCGEQLQGRGTGDHLYCSAAVRLQCSTYCTAATVPYSVGSHLDSGHRGPPWRCNHGVVLIVGDRKKELKQTSVISPFKQTSVICNISIWTNEPILILFFHMHLPWRSIIFRLFPFVLCLPSLHIIPVISKPATLTMQAVSPNLWVE